MCLYEVKKAKDFVSGQPIGLSDVADYHLFPKSAFKDHQHVNAVLNRTLLDKNTNSMAVKGKKLPSQYLPEFSALLSGGETHLRAILATHGIDEAAFDAMKTDKFDTFLEAREKTILESIQRLVAGGSP